MLRDWLDTELAEPAKVMRKAGRPDLCGGYLQDVPIAGPADRRGAQRRDRGSNVLTANGLRQLIAFISGMTTEDRAELEGSQCRTGTPDRGRRPGGGGEYASTVVGIGSRYAVGVARGHHSAPVGQ